MVLVSTRYVPALQKNNIKFKVVQKKVVAKQDRTQFWSCSTTADSQKEKGPSHSMVHGCYMDCLRSHNHVISVSICINSLTFAGNSAILRRSCYKEVTFFLTINVFWSQQHIVQRKSFFVCMLVKFVGIIYKERLPATRKPFIPHNIYHNINIIANARETVLVILKYKLKVRSSVL